MRRTGRRALCLLTLAIGPTWIGAISFTPFGSHGEGGDVNGQQLTIGSGGTVRELDSFLYIQGLDLNGAETGVTARLSKDSLPTNLNHTFSEAEGG